MKEDNFSRGKKRLLTKLGNKKLVFRLSKKLKKIPEFLKDIQYN